MSEVITLSSDEDEGCEPQTKRIKLTAPFSPKSVAIILKDSMPGNPGKVLLLTRDNLNNKRGPEAAVTDTDDNSKKDDVTIVADDEDSGRLVNQNEECTWKISEITSVIENVTNTHLLAGNNVSKLSANLKKITTTEVNLPSQTTNHQLNNDLRNIPSTSTSSDAENVFLRFLEHCSKSLDGSMYEKTVCMKYEKIKVLFESCLSIHNEYGFIKLIEENLSKASKSAQDAVVAFQRIYSHLKDTCNNEEYEIEFENLEKVRKLEKTMQKLIKRLKRLDECEVNWSDEENSHYMQRDRYAARLNLVHNKYCELLKKNPYYGRITHEKLRYSQSKHELVNKSLSKLYRNDQVPCYADVESCLRDCVKKHCLPVTEDDIRIESKHCFITMGNNLQLRRKKELYENQLSFISSSEDPALKDSDLDKKLQESGRIRENSINTVVEKYVRLQEARVDKESSEWSWPSSSDSSMSNKDA